MTIPNRTSRRAVLTARTVLLRDEVQVYGVPEDTHSEFTSDTAPAFQGAWKAGE